MCQQKNEYTIEKSTILSEKDSILAKDPFLKGESNFSINCIEYAPKIFSFLREIDDVSLPSIIQSLLPMSNGQGIQKSAGRSNSFFISTDDKQLILKTISPRDAKLLCDDLLEKMSEHFITHKDSIISRLYGLYELKIPTGIFTEDQIFFILMKNVYGTFSKNVLCKYDLKGSTLNREVKVDIGNADTEVLKDINFKEMENNTLLINDETKNKLNTTTANDALLLANLGIMDYSLLVVKITVNKDESRELFGKHYRRQTEKEYTDRLGLNVSMKSEEEERKEVEEDEHSETNMENIRFDLDKVKNLRKYIYPSLYIGQAYIIAIIDFFQLYDFQKKMETGFKMIKAEKNAISSMNPNDYFSRFIAYVTNITNGKCELQRRESHSSQKNKDTILAISEVSREDEEDSRQDEEEEDTK